MATDGQQETLSPATYADLFALEQESESIDAVATAFQEALSQSLFKKRASLAARVPNFWPLVFEQAPPDVDQYILPSDSEVLTKSLTGFSVSRFGVKGGPEDFANALKSDAEVSEQKFGEPRSVSFRFEFKDNDWFHDKVLEKTFHYRRSVEGKGEEAPTWDGRVSEPVKINWKKGKDLSHGLTDAACALWDAMKKKDLIDAKDYEASQANDKETNQLPEYQSLVEKLDNSAETGQSFFNWFGYHGPWVSAAQDVAARKVEAERRQNPPQADAGKAEDAKEAEDGEEEDLDEMPAHLAVEVFPDGEELALALAEDVWPNAIKYFLQAQEDDDSDDMDAESFDEEELEGMDEEDIGKANLEDIKALSGRVKKEDRDAPPLKKRKA